MRVASGPLSLAVRLGTRAPHSRADACACCCLDRRTRHAKKIRIASRRLLAGYTISISLLGEPLPGSPFICHASTPTPSAPLCVLRGAALHSATARKEETFEVKFVDATGEVAHAPLGGRWRAGAPRAAAWSMAAARRGWRIIRCPARAAASGAGGIGHVRLSGRVAAPTGAHGFVPMLGKTRECLVTSTKPLVVRADADLDSPKVGQLQPGQRITLVEMRTYEEDGLHSVRARVVLAGPAHQPPPEKADPDAVIGKSTPRPPTWRFSRSRGVAEWDA